MVTSLYRELIVTCDILTFLWSKCQSSGSLTIWFWGGNQVDAARPLVKYDVDSHKLWQFTVGFIVYMSYILVIYIWQHTINVEFGCLLPNSCRSLAWCLRLGEGDSFRCFSHKWKKGLGRVRDLLDGYPPENWHELENHHCWKEKNIFKWLSFRCHLSFPDG